MIWLYPAAAIALVALVIPVLVHILARQRATRLPFPSLRFIQPQTLAAVRRRALNDVALLAVRASILAAAVGAITGPFLETASRRRAWDARTIRAEVTEPETPAGIVRAVSWLSRQPPGRREVVIRGALPVGTVTDADIAAVPQHIGVRFERTTTLPPSRTLEATAVSDGGRIVERQVTLRNEDTSVRDLRATGTASAPIEIVAPAAHRAAADRLAAAFARERLPVALPNRIARVEFAQTAAALSPVSAAWMADAAAQLARSLNLRDAPAALQFGADANRLVVVTPMAPADARAPELLRAVADSLAAAADQPEREIVPIPDAQLRAWSREPGPAIPPTPDMIIQDDRRWLWALALGLLALEWWTRRDRVTMVDSRGGSSRAA
jgi:Aerotolerance regulator N-terminal